MGVYGPRGNRAWVTFLVRCLEEFPGCRSSHTYWSDSRRVLGEVHVLGRALLLGIGVEDNEQKSGLGRSRLQELGLDL
ncbi:hypothetical protein ACFX13_029820 [Malus domestica]